MTEHICTAPKCLRHVHALNLCKSHYSRFRRYGVLEPLRTPNGEARAYFTEHLMTVTDACKIWPYGIDPDGYGYVNFNERPMRVHRLACEAWHGPAPIGMSAAHGECHNRACWNGAHLSWKTPKGQQDDTIRDGTKLIGSAKPNAKFTDAQVREIRKLHTVGVPRRLLADQFGVHHNTIDLVVRRKSYAHVE